MRTCPPPVAHFALQALGLMDGVALALWAIGFGFEFVADLEKFTFRGKVGGSGARHGKADGKAEA